MHETSRFFNLKVQKGSVIIKGKLNQLYPQGMRSFEQYDEICRYFAEGKQRDNNTDEVEKHLQLHDLNVGNDKYALWLDFRTIDANALHETSMVIGSTDGRITLQIQKKAETAGELKTYIYLIMDV